MDVYFHLKGGCTRQYVFWEKIKTKEILWHEFHAKNDSGYRTECFKAWWSWINPKKKNDTSFSLMCGTRLLIRNILAYPDTIIWCYWNFVSFTCSVTWNYESPFSIYNPKLWRQFFFKIAHTQLVNPLRYPTSNCIKY